MKKSLLVVPFLLITFSTLAKDISNNIIDAKSQVPGLITDIRYATDNNFVGVKVDGYSGAKCLLHKEAAIALNKVQRTLSEFGFGLKAFDCFRPQRAVDHFVRWAEDIKDVKTKAEYYPKVPKTELFEQGYIAAKSGHSRGATIDLTVIKLTNNNELDMGSPFDYFDAVSHTINSSISKEQQQNRLLLKNAMEQHGFKNYSQEWWHYTFKPEPTPDTYFDGEIE